MEGWLSRSHWSRREIRREGWGMPHDRVKICDHGSDKSSPEPGSLHYWNSVKWSGQKILTKGRKHLRLSSKKPGDQFLKTTFRNGGRAGFRRIRLSWRIKLLRTCLHACSELCFKFISIRIRNPCFPVYIKEWQGSETLLADTNNNERPCMIVFVWRRNTFINT